jgi:hypothetical protein
MVLDEEPHHIRFAALDRSQQRPHVNSHSSFFSCVFSIPYHFKAAKVGKDFTLTAFDDGPRQVFPPSSSSGFAYFFVFIYSISLLFCRPNSIPRTETSASAFHCCFVT